MVITMTTSYDVDGSEDATDNCIDNGNGKGENDDGNDSDNDGDADFDEKAQRAARVEPEDDTDRQRSV